MRPRLVELTIAASVPAWRAIGVDVDEGCSRVGAVGLRFVDADADGSGIVGWTIAVDPDDDTDRSDVDDIDGVPTVFVAADTDTSADWPSAHPIAATRIDHVVLMTSSLERTCAEVERCTGSPLKRIREAGSVRQGFHRLGEVILEVVESPQNTADTASFWGLVLVVDDVDAVSERLSDTLIGSARDAVQPGRRIASFRPAADLGLPVALMTS
jgi:hypothetical protein